MRTIEVSFNGKLVLTFFSAASNEITNHSIALELLHRDQGIDARFSDIGHSVRIVVR